MVDKQAVGTEGLGTAYTILTVLDSEKRLINRIRIKCANSLEIKVEHKHPMVLLGSSPPDTEFKYDIWVPA
jgi:hypothetical protein